VTSFVRRTIAAAALLAASLGGAAVAAAPAQAALVSISTLEYQVVKLTNQHRVANGCGSVVKNTALRTAAYNHSKDMATANYFAHTSPSGTTFTQRATAAGYSSAIGENIAWGYPTAEQAMTSWMNSAVHRANVLNCTAKSVGVGAYRRADGRVYWTQVFGGV
jgi:uncharacterized protein YkwD